MSKISNQMSIGLVALALGGAALVAGSALAVSHSETSQPKTPALSHRAWRSKPMTNGALAC
jgi:hypothetical protein